MRNNLGGSLFSAIHQVGGPCAFAHS